MSKATKIAASLRDRGFDLTATVFGRPNLLTPRCSQCEALVINGAACHEGGCPNNRRRSRFLVGCGEFEE